MPVNKMFLLLLLLLSVDALAAYVSIFRPPAHSVRHSTFASRDLSSENYGRFSGSFPGTYNEQPLYPVAQEPLYPAAQEPLFPTAQEPLYPAAQDLVYPSAELPLYSTTTHEPLYLSTQEAFNSSNAQPLIPESDTRVFKSPVSKHKEVLSLINGPAPRKLRSTPEWRSLMKAFQAVWTKEWITTSLARYEPSKRTWAYFS